MVAKADCVGKIRIQLDEEVREEIETWRFLDEWEQPLPWRSQWLRSVSLATDASSLGMGASVISGVTGGQEVYDY